MLNPKMLSAIEAWYKHKTGQDVVLVAIVLIFLPDATARGNSANRYYELRRLAPYQIYQAKHSALLKAGSGSNDSIFILIEGEARHFSAESFQLHKVAAYPIQVSLPKLLQETLKGESRSFIQSLMKRCYGCYRQLFVS